MLYVVILCYVYMYNLCHMLSTCMFVYQVIMCMLYVFFAGGTVERHHGRVAFQLKELIKKTDKQMKGA